MAELLLEKGYTVFGMIRRSSSQNMGRIAHLTDKIHLTYGDLTDSSSVEHIVKECAPHEIYNLAAMSFVPASWNQPIMTMDVNCNGLLRLIEASEQFCSKIYQASTSEMYGNSYPEFKPVSPYGISKLAAHNLVGAFRKQGRFICSGICFNHESPRRGNEFVTKKIVNYVKNPVGKLKLGNLNASRDWGFAGDYVYAMWLMMQEIEPRDYEIATGETHTIRDFLNIALPDWEDKVEVDPQFIRKNEVDVLKGNPEAIKQLGWQPMVSFEKLVEMMVNE